MIARCRLLRSLDKSVALKMLNSAGLAMQDIFDEFEPSYVLSVTVDSYIIHLLSIISESRGIRFIGLVPTFINGYFRITTCGAKGAERLVSDEELNEVKHSLLDKTYKPSWLVSNKRDINKKANRMWLRNFIKPIWFLLLSYYKGDRFNAHYMTSRIISQRYWSFFPRSYSGLDSIARITTELDKTSKPVFFLPLQMSPEATIDYWSSDTSWIDYECKVLEVIRSNSEKSVFLIKEHPNVLGFRSRDFYKKLGALDNVVLVSPEIPSNEILDISDAVVVCTGTVGLEALLRGKVVFSDSSPFYAKLDKFRPCAAISEFVSVSLNQNDSDSDSDSLVRYVLGGFSRGVFLNDGSWKKGNEQHKQWNMTIASSISETLI
tara:strand:- start:132 stop:1262 length:1131 start_codon:yes stop_codon:yes gene_type:complete